MRVQMKKIFAVLLILCAFSISFAQGQTHKLAMDRGFFTTDYTIDGQEVDCDAFEQELARVPEAISKWNTGNILRYTSWGIAGVGGFIVGYNIAQSQNPTAEDPNAYKRYLGLGAAIIVAAFVVEYIGNSKKDGAVELYNQKIGNIAGNHPVNWSLVPTEQGGIALAFNF